jgi:hypothetical protein
MMTMTPKSGAPAWRIVNQSQLAKTLLKNAGEVIRDAKFYGESDSEVGIAKKVYILYRRIEHFGPDRA